MQSAQLMRAGIIDDVNQLKSVNVGHPDETARAIFVTDDNSNSVSKDSDKEFRQQEDTTDSTDEHDESTLHYSADNFTLVQDELLNDELLDSIHSDNITDPRTFLSTIFRPLANAIPTYCWHNNKQYNCGLGITCRASGGKTIAGLCGRGSVWSCCVPKDQVDAPAVAQTISDPSK